MRIAVGDLGEAVNALDVDPTRARLEMLIGPQGHVHGLGDVDRTHAPVRADQAKARGEHRVRRLDVPGVHVSVYSLAVGITRLRT
ncbi:hypothetical protein D3C80_1683770 [compost metagenome]